MEIICHFKHNNDGSEFIAKMVQREGNNGGCQVADSTFLDATPVFFDGLDMSRIKS